MEVTRSQPNGSAYGRKEAHPDEILVGVAQGTPCGEYMRRYWQPVGVSSSLTSDRPQKVKILGEELVLFRDKTGRAGLLYPRCMHRGTTLYYGKIEEKGLRCCYHGWLFDVEGNCLEQPCEPDGGKNKENARQPWYPVAERYGLVFAYMGPQDKMPVLPKYDIFENLTNDEEFLVEGTGYFGYGAPVADPHVGFHWLQNWENIVDPYHTYVLHSTFSAIQFSDPLKVAPKVKFENIPGGVIYRAFRGLDDGRMMERVNSALLPNVSVIPEISAAEGRSIMMGWHVAVDDTTFRAFLVRKIKKGTTYFTGIKAHNGKIWTEATEEERRDFPSDYEAQSGQGPVTLHSEEHLATSDLGIVMLRRKMKQQIDVVAKGGNPEGAIYDEGQALVTTLSGNYYTAPQKAAS
ncbi:MAG: Rieske 2Fe-2S domain-containing protein [Alphaproteobacteria bacterium]|nr:Rieske 2Fe-2S domain-containing protein [Alphaproteobacteria bacterium]